MRNVTPVKIGFRRCHESTPYGVSLDVLHTVEGFLFGCDLAFIEAAHPHIVLALEAEGEAAFDELHGFLK